MWKHYNDILTNKQKSLSLASPFTGETERGKDSTGMEQEKKSSPANDETVIFLR